MMNLRAKIAFTCKCRLELGNICGDVDDREGFGVGVGGESLFRDAAVIGYC